MQTFDLEALKNNALYFSNLIGKSKLCAVVKNDAYGHGLNKFVQTLAPIVDYFAVGNIDEALTCKNSNKQVLILLPCNKRDCELAIANNICLTVDSFSTLDIVAKTAQKLSKTAQIHLKFDSGMHRLGFDFNQLATLASKLVLFGNCVKVVGLYSHFATNDLQTCNKQFVLFNDICTQFQKVFGKCICHISNTSGTALDKKFHLDMCRIGLGLYGYGDKNLQPVKKVSAKVIAIRNCTKGEVVGYDGKYVCPRDTKIAIVNYGYADGLPRVMTNSCVSIRGKQYKIVGNICMAMLFVDVGQDDVSLFDDVILLGKENILANHNVTIYELLCNLH